ncbi:MAG: type II toxin-antitoxin system HicB family antitoxin [Actinomycetota bacterium]|nr:type II toxin-antitoxin system HicB family antitoxin [Actinomycetota bacterium]
MSNPSDYLILLEQGLNGWGAWSPDLPGCVAAGDTKDETVTLMREAIALHLAGIAEDRDPIPTPSGPGVYVEEHAAAA